MKRNRVLIVVLLLLALSSCGGSNSNNIINYITAESYLKSEAFVGTVLIRKNNQYILKKGFGYSNSDLELLNNVDSRFRIGSLTKSFTALAIVQLKNNNTISSYDDPIGNYVSDYPKGGQISIRHLLTHRSGIPDYTDRADENRIYSPPELLDIFKSASLEFTPGTQFSYSNSNYVLLGYLIEELTGLDYITYLQLNIINPLALANTKYSESILESSEYATGYIDSSQTQTSSYYDMSIPYSAGGLSSDLTDLEVWADSFENKSLITEQNYQDIFSSDQYGFGWGITKINESVAYVHGGEVSGFSSMITILPERKGLIILLSNIEGQGTKLQELVNTITINEF